MTETFCRYFCSNICKWPPYLLQQVTLYVRYPRYAGYMEFNINQFTHNQKLNDVIKLTPKEDDKLKRYEYIYVVLLNSGKTILVKNKVELYQVGKRQSTRTTCINRFYINQNMGIRHIPFFFWMSKALGNCKTTRNHRGKKFVK